MSHLSMINKAEQKPVINSEKIEEKRKQLFRIAEIYGMYAAETLQCSQELDRMIAEVLQKSLPAES
ncbi:aspartyl-phosphate phosphatase Spo0E family protein [Sporolactobacillus sp. THM7-7]|nr:aspartyl-phosphate phosphatase Spo0E family protein [Sporolactobacillus sp. THM7-7]